MINGMMIHAAQKRKEFNTLFIVTIRKSSHFLPDNLCLGKYKEIQYYSQCIEHQSAHNGMCYMIDTDTIEIDNGTDDGNTQCIGKDNVKNANYTYNDTFKKMLYASKKTSNARYAMISRIPEHSKSIGA